jgi:rubrerythrin
VIRILEEGRAREREQTLFYRGLAGEASRCGDAELAERLNALHADEQHHLSRLTARILELGGEPEEIPLSLVSRPAPDVWEDVARAREEAEVAWYQARLVETLDPDTRELLQEILDSEEHHSRELGGKWMSA